MILKYFTIPVTHIKQLLLLVFSITAFIQAVGNKTIQYPQHQPKSVRKDLTLSQ